MSQQDAVKEIIGDKEYTMYPLGPTESMDLLTDVTAVIAPTILPMINAVFSGEKGLDTEIDASIFSNVGTQLNSRELKTVRKSMESAFRKVTMVDGAILDGTFEAHFRGKIDELLKWLVWGMRVQWGKCLKGLGSNLPSPVQEKVSLSQST